MRVRPIDGPLEGSEHEVEDPLLSPGMTAHLTWTDQPLGGYYVVTRLLDKELAEASWVAVG